jgi:predicted lipoprotein with Yx(FWY)xxD motif
MHKNLRLLAAGFSLAAILAACSSTGASPSAAAPTVAAPSVAPSVAAPAAAASAEASAAASAEASAPASAATASAIALKTGALGSYIVDGDGKTLYVFLPDEAAGKPTCYDKCAGAWPALTAASVPTVGTGLDATKLVLVDRTDGTKQVMFGKYPLYYFSGDKAAGDTNGQGVGGNWFVVGADGEEIKAGAS